MDKFKQVKQPKKPTEKELMRAGIYKGYSVNWLRKEPEHPHFHLVAEYDALMAKE